MGTPTLYLDTSVLGGYFDDEWKFPTRELWRQMEQGKFRFFTSSIAADELIEAPSASVSFSSMPLRQRPFWM